jgi:hypothetical protein
MRSRALKRFAAVRRIEWCMAVVGSVMMPVVPALAQPTVSIDARAGEPIVTSTTEPWSAGLTPGEKSGAEALLARGNELLVQNHYAAALQVYELAIRAWDHPAIRANMAICFINLDRPLEAYETVQLALRYGSAPFDKPEVYTATLNYKKLLEGQIGFLQLRCTEPGAKVTLDGRDLLDCPGELKRALLPGSHQLVAQKFEFLTITRNVTVRSQTTETIDLRMVRLSDAARMGRRWSNKVPIAVTGGGAALVALGAFLQHKAEVTMRRYDGRLRSECPLGCAPWNTPPQVDAIRERAELGNRIANIALVTGALVGTTGLVLFYLNRSRVVRLDDPGVALWLPPTETGGMGLSLAGQF